MVFFCSPLLPHIPLVFFLLVLLLLLLLLLLLPFVTGLPRKHVHACTPPHTPTAYAHTPARAHIHRPTQSPHHTKPRNSKPPTLDDNLLLTHEGDAVGGEILRQQRAQVHLVSG